MVELGRFCPACGKTATALLLFQVAPGRHVCEECFLKVQAVENDASGVLRTENGNG
jgi:uncharacterized OB-fold protein